MPRLARVVVPGTPHHITQRGNRGASVFFSKADRLRYLELLAEYAALHSVEITAYCLMTNHVHLIATPATKEALGAMLKPVHLRYAQELNRQQGEHGILWQGRFYSCAMDDDHFWEAVRYVERNPVRAKMVERADQYPWSSAAAHCGLRTDELLTELTARPVETAQWAAWLGDEEDPAVQERLRAATRTGRPAGGEAFVDFVEKVLGRVVRRRKAGRPRKVRE